MENLNESRVEGRGSSAGPLAHFYFHYRGKEYKAFKRVADRNAPYYVKVERRGKVIKRNLESNVRDQAEKRAAEIIELVLTDRLDELERTKLRGAPKKAEGRMKNAEVATLGEVAAAYRLKASVFLKPRSINDNLNSLRLLVREGLGKPAMSMADVEALSTSVLDGGMVARFEEGRLRGAVRNDEESRQSALVSVNAYARQARSVFKEKFLKAYTRDMKLVLPKLKDFLEEELQAPARQVKEAAPESLIASTFAAARALKAADYDAYIAFLLGLVSLRRGEVQQAQWSWLIESDLVIRVPRESKSKVIRLVPVPRAVMVELLQYKAEGRRQNEEGDFILPSPTIGRGGPEAKARGQAIIKRVNLWMRSIGWSGARYKHTLHELRAYYLRELRKVYGLEVAGEAGGHSDLRVTREHYTGRLDMKGVELVLPLEGKA